MPAEYLTRPIAAEHLTERGLRITKGTLQKMATVGGGPSLPALWQSRGLHAGRARRMGRDEATGTASLY